MDRIIIIHEHSPGTASSARVIAYAKAFISCGKEVKVIFRIRKDVERISIPNVEIVFVNNFGCKNKIKREYLSIQKIKNEIKSFYIKDKTKIFIYQIPNYTLLLKEYYNDIFCEETEFPGFGLKQKIKERINIQIKKYVAKKIRGLFVITESLKEYYLKLGVKQVEVINMFVDKDRFDNIINVQKDKTISYCGTISVHKDGVDDLIEAFSIICNKYSEYKLKIIGRFQNAEVESILRNLVNSKGIADRVIFTGLISTTELPLLLKKSSILALARPQSIQAQYGFPTKLGEYLCSGVPVVITKVGEIDNFLKDKFNAIIAEPSNPKDFANKLSWAIDNYEQALLYAQNALLLVDNEFSSSVQAHKAIKFMS